MVPWAIRWAIEGRGAGFGVGGDGDHRLTVDAFDRSGAPRCLEVGDGADGQSAIAETDRQFLELVEGLPVLLAVLDDDVELAVFDLEVGHGARRQGRRNALTDRL